MGRELKRVPLDFDWPLMQPWKGYLNPHYVAKDCAACQGQGWSPEAKHMNDLWYGYVPFKPEDRGSMPFLPTDAVAVTWAKWQCERTPNYYGTGPLAIQREAERICRIWNSSWRYHLNADDLVAVLAKGRIHDLTHTWSKETKWVKRDPMPVITPRQWNEHHCLNGLDDPGRYAVMKAEAIRLGVAMGCSVCQGEYQIWPSPEAKTLYENWEKEEPPVGEGYQVWETVSEGSPTSPVFTTARDLARHMATTRHGADEGTSEKVWMQFIVRIWFGTILDCEKRGGNEWC